jgi:hypothetical protein
VDWLAGPPFPLKERNFSLGTHQTRSGTHLGPYTDSSGGSFNEGNVVIKVHIVQQALYIITAWSENQANCHIRKTFCWSRLCWTCLDLGFSSWYADLWTAICSRLYHNLRLYNNFMCRVPWICFLCYRCEGWFCMYSVAVDTTMTSSRLRGSFSHTTRSYPFLQWWWWWWWCWYTIRELMWNYLWKG